MIEAIGMKLVASLLVFIFEVEVLDKNKIFIDGVPSWYMNEKFMKDDNFYVFDYFDGDLNAVDRVKEKVIKKMENRIREATTTVIDKEFPHLKDKKEKSFINIFKNDKKLSLFVKENITFENVSYSKDEKRAFASGYISKAKLEKYYKKRVFDIKEEVLNIKFENMMDELEEETR